MSGLRYRARFSSDQDPLEEVQWVTTKAEIKDGNGAVIFDEDVEAPSTWTPHAVSIVASKYFHGTPGRAGRESSVKHLIGRVSDQIKSWGRTGQYFDGEESLKSFYFDLRYILVNQLAAFNSPVWFNVGVETKPQCSACLPFDALVNTTDGLVPIGELHKQSVRFGVQSLPGVFDSEGKPSDIVATERTLNRDVYTIDLEDGSHVKMTDDHLIKAVNKYEKESWKSAGDLDVEDGDRVLMSSSPLLGWLGSEPVKEAWLLGLMSGSGHMGTVYGGSEHSDAAPCFKWGFQVPDKILAVTAGLHLDASTVSHKLVHHEQDGWWEVCGEGSEGESLWSPLAAAEQQVPPSILDSSQETWVLYLRGLFDSVGGVVESFGWAHPVMFLMRRKQAEQVQVMLRSIGIWTRLTTAEPRGNYPSDFKPTRFRLAVHDERSVEVFKQKIGFTAATTREMLERTKTPHHAFKKPYLKVKSVKKTSNEVVFDIQTRCETFWASGILVHNCFIQSVDDTMESILDLAKKEGMLFKYGSGTGSNLSKLRGEGESLSSGGTSSGPVSFMKGFDAFAGVIKSAGRSRRAAKLICLDADHPDILKFIKCKAEEEKKAWALIEQGYDGAFTGEAYGSIFYQNANHSVRVSDDFMEAVEHDSEVTVYEVKSRKTQGEV